MQAEQVAKAIKAEFGVFCGVYTGHGGTPYYLWNPPHDVYDEKLRDFKRRIEARIEELEQQEENEE